jgi:hypothetical protein
MPGMYDWNCDGTYYDVCECRGVHCDDDSLVNYINLFSGGISGTLSPTIGQLTNLRYFTLDYNSINGSIPTEVG